MKTCLVTGGARGIGEAISRRLCADGYFVIINYNNSKSEAEALAFELKNAAAIKADVSDRKEVFSMVERAAREFSPVELLVNNAGIAAQKLFTDITEDEFDLMYQVNLKGVFNACQAVIPDMVRRKRGSIINISSMWGQVGASCEAHYSAMKAAVIGLTKSLAKELGPSGITVNCVAPGVILTDMCNNLGETTLSELAEETPLQRNGAPQDVANAVAFLAGENASFITGQILGCSGGLVI